MTPFTVIKRPMREQRTKHCHGNIKACNVLETKRWVLPWQLTLLEIWSSRQLGPVLWKLVHPSSPLWHAAQKQNEAGTELSTLAWLSNDYVIKHDVYCKVLGLIDGILRHDGDYLPPSDAWWDGASLVCGWQMPKKSSLLEGTWLRPKAVIVRKYLWRFQSRFLLTWKWLGQPGRNVVLCNTDCWCFVRKKVLSLKVFLLDMHTQTCDISCKTLAEQAVAIQHATLEKQNGHSLNPLSTGQSKIGRRRPIKLDNHCVFISQRISTSKISLERSFPYLNVDILFLKLGQKMTPLQLFEVT